MALPPSRAGLANERRSKPTYNDGATSILTPEELNDFLRDNSGWKTQSVDIQGVQYLIPYTITGAKITKITVDPGNSGIIKIPGPPILGTSRPTDLFIARSLFNPIISRRFNVIRYHEAGQAKEEDLDVKTFVYRLANGNIQTFEAFRFDFTNMDKPAYLGILTYKEQSHSDEGNHSDSYWDKMDNLFYTTMKDARTAFKTNQIINVTIVAIGIVLISNSIAYTWYKQTADAWSFFSGGIGILAFFI
jgi:hypothetical protein